jgi:hypothetical protein
MSILNRVIEITARKIYEKHVIVLLDLPWKWQVGKSYVSCLIGIFNSDSFHLLMQKCDQLLIKWKK